VAVLGGVDAEASVADEEGRVGGMILIAVGGGASDIALPITRHDQSSYSYIIKKSGITAEYKFKKKLQSYRSRAVI